jgi:hypothetical protein
MPAGDLLAEPDPGPALVDCLGNPGRVPEPSRDGRNRAKPGLAHATGAGGLPGNAALGFAAAALAGLAHLALLLDRRLLVVPTSLDLLQDPLFGHLLLQDLERLVHGIANFYFERTAKQCLQAWGSFEEGGI